MIISFSYGCNETGERIKGALHQIFPDMSARVLVLGNDLYYEFTFTTGDEWEHRFDLNPINVIEKLALDPLWSMEMLEAAYIPCVFPRPAAVRLCYSVVVYGGDSVSIVQTTGPNFRDRRRMNEKSVPKVAEIAKKAVYAVGLDYARVQVITGAGNRYRVAALDPAPELDDKDIKRLMSLISSDFNARAAELRRDLRLGADPEFMIANRGSGKMIPASYLFPHEGTVGCDSLRIPNRQQRPIAEIRPRPSNSPFTLFKNIRSALEAAQRLAPYRNIVWLAGSQPFNGFYTGGHIHFSPIKANNQLLRALDNYIALPLMMLETPKTSIARRKKYGMLADHRAKEHGGFEYRTLSSWLYSEEICLGVLCLAKIVSAHYPRLERNLLNTPAALYNFYQCNKHHFKTCMNDLWRDLRSTASYNLYQAPLETLFTMIVNGGEGEYRDVKTAWRIGAGTALYRAPQNASGYSYERRIDSPVRAAGNSANEARRPAPAPAGTGAVRRTRRTTNNTGNNARQRANHRTGSRALRQSVPQRVNHA